VSFLAQVWRSVRRTISYQGDGCEERDRCSIVTLSTDLVMPTTRRRSGEPRYPCRGAIARRQSAPACRASAWTRGLRPISGGRSRSGVLSIRTCRPPSGDARQAVPAIMTYFGSRGNQPAALTSRGRRSRRRTRTTKIDRRYLGSLRSQPGAAVNRGSFASTPNCREGAAGTE